MKAKSAKLIWEFNDKRITPSFAVVKIEVPDDFNEYVDLKQWWKEHQSGRLAPEVQIDYGDFLPDDDVWERHYARVRGYGIFKDNKLYAMIGDDGGNLQGVDDNKPLQNCGATLDFFIAHLTRSGVLEKSIAEKLENHRNRCRFDYSGRIPVGS